MGTTSAAVPVKKASSARYRSVRTMSASRTRMPSSAAICRMLARVMPARQPAASGGVQSTPSRTTKTFSPEPSVTYPLGLSRMPSS
jgi:hypothetical protein